MSFERLLKPRSIAVFGGAHAEEMIRQNDRMGYEGEIWPVHPKKAEVLGRKVYRSVAELPGSPDAAYLGVNRHLTIDIVRDLAERDAGGAVCSASGFAEAGEVEERIKTMAPAYGMQPEKLRAELDKRNAVERLQSDIRAEKALDVLLGQAKVKR